MSTPAPVTEAHLALLDRVSIALSRYDRAEAAQHIADSEARAVTAVTQWHPASVSPSPSVAGVLCDAYLAITIDSERPCVLTYIYANRQWTHGEGDTQRIKCWGHIVPQDWCAENNRLRDELEQSQNVVIFTRQHAILAMDRIRALVGATDADPLSAEHYVAEALGKLRAIFPQICKALGNGSCCAPDVSLDFLQSIPNEVAGVVANLRAEVDAQCLLNAKGSGREAVLLGRVDRMAKECLNLRAELAAERARLDYMSNCGFEHLHNETGDHLGHEWTISGYGESRDVTLRDVIDAEMKEETK